MPHITYHLRHGASTGNTRQWGRKYSEEQVLQCNALQGKPNMHRPLPVAVKSQSYFIAFELSQMTMSVGNLNITFDVHSKVSLQQNDLSQ